jgi:glycosyltransferase involved in cell wall biosynthesis
MRYPARQVDDMATGSLSVFFPCFDEEANVERVVRQAIAVLDGLGRDFEVIVVDDGSRDATGAIAERLAAADPRVRVVRHAENRGYGAALQSGIRAATRELVFFTDGDGQFDLAELPPLLPLVAEFDLVAAWRIDRQDPWPRRLNAWCWTRLVNAVFGMSIRDVNCAFKLFRREVLATMPLESTGALISAEILARATRRGCRIAQPGVHHLPRTAGAQTGARPGVILRAFRELLELRRRILADEGETAA